jgi:TRAP-type C4-dicarboxylate transport system permease small subunit
MIGLKWAYDMLEEAVCVFFFLLIFFLMNLGVFGRYFFDLSFEWNIELCSYSFVWLTFLGAAFVRKKYSHIKVEFFYTAAVRRLPLAGRRAIYLIKELIMFFFLGTLIVLGVELAVRSWRFASQAMQISQFFLYISVPVGAAMFLYREILRIIESRFGAIPERTETESGNIG